jgi:hypothetical protein
VSVVNRFGLARAAIVTGARAVSGTPLRSLPPTGVDVVIIDILDPLAHETGVAIAAFIVDRPQP